MFRDRVDAGRQLASKLDEVLAGGNAIVLGIPRGGVVVAAEVAAHLAAPLDVVAAAKVGAPGNPEFAVGAVTADGEVLVNLRAGFSEAEVNSFSNAALTKVEHSLDLFRAGRQALEVKGRDAIVVDDGIATGLTAQAAIEYLRRAGAKRVVLAAPVASAEATRILEPLVDALVVVDVPREFSAVGQFYLTFGQTTDEEVQQLLSSQSLGGTI